MRDLKDRTALVTGASQGIGVYIARALAAEGMNLILAARSADKLESVAEDLRATGCRVLCIPTDLSDRASLTALVERAEGEGGGVDLLINNAGVELSMAFDKVPVGDIDQIIEVNLRAPIVLSRLLLSKMIQRGQGHIVNISSLAGLGGAAYQELYCATKHGLVGFTRSLRATASNEGYPVGCSVVCPGFIDDVGMYMKMSRESGVKAPLSFGTSPPERVARAVVRAVKRHVPEIVVNPMPMRPLVAVALFAPRFALWLLNRLGISRFFEAAAKQQSGRSDTAADPVPDTAAPTR
jgi:short-subunit dehydrogenase